MKTSAAIGIVFNESRDQVLLIKRRDVPLWVLPGGGIEPDESPEEAVIREVWEETGLRVEIIKKIAEYKPLNRLSQITHVFECKKIDGIERIGCETKEVKYFNFNCLPKSFFIVHQDWLKDALLEDKTKLNDTIWRVTYFELFKYFLKHPLIVLRFILPKA
jgi:8-oxo-dGTP diphosphatase